MHEDTSRSANPLFRFLAFAMRDAPTTAAGGSYAVTLPTTNAAASFRLKQ